MVLSGIAAQFFHIDPAMSSSDAVAMILIGTGTGFAGVLVLPSLGIALARILGRRIANMPALPGYLRPTLLIFAFPIVILLGYAATHLEPLTWLILPPIHIIAVGLPVLWLLYIAIHHLPSVGPQAFWGIFAAGTVLGPAIVLIVEVVALLGYVLLFAATLSAQPELSQELVSLVERLTSSSANPAASARILGPYLVRPGVIAAVIVFGALIVPMIEEVIKPIGVWLLVGRNLNPTQGFVVGALCGAGYAIFESLLLASSVESWAALVSARTGTSVIHITTTALVGWALASAWSQNRYVRLGFIYLGAVLLHGFWNALTMMNTMLEIGREFASDANVPLLLEQVGSFAPFGLIFTAIIALILLIYANYRLRLMNQ
jgi:hypothetical protein